MVKNIFGLFTFENSHLVLRAEKILELENVDIRVIPLPTEISAGCGLAIRCDLDNVNTILKTLECSDISYKGVYKVVRDGLDKEIMEI